jgi:hypothetical protein
VVRGVAEGRDLAATKVGDIYSQELTSVSPTDEVEQAVLLIREKAVRRLPVVEGGKPVGVVSIGDLAIERDPHSALGKISAAPPNRWRLLRQTADSRSSRGGAERRPGEASTVSGGGRAPHCHRSDGRLSSCLSDRQGGGTTRFIRTTDRAIFNNAAQAGIIPSSGGLCPPACRCASLAYPAMTGAARRHIARPSSRSEREWPRRFHIEKGRPAFSLGLAATVSHLSRAEALLLRSS